MDLEIFVSIYNFLAAMKVLIKKSLCMPCLCVSFVHFVNVHVSIENIMQERVEMSCDLKDHFDSYERASCCNEISL